MNNVFRHIFAVIIILCFVSCQKRDFHLLSKSEMVDILTELYLTEASFETAFVRGEQKKLAYYNSLFNKYNITRYDFEKSAAYYARRGKDFELIYETVLDSLKVKERLVNAHYYHPLLCEDDNSTINRDTLNLWRDDKRVVWHPDSLFRKDSLTFEFSDSNFFAVGDKFVLYFLQSTARCDSLIGAYASMFVRYRNDVVDSVEAMLLPDNRVRRYTLSVNNIDSLRPISVYGNLLCFDSVTGTPDRWFDSIAVYRIYDCQAHPLPDSIKKQFIPQIAIQDSLKKRSFPLMKSHSLKSTKRPFELKKVK